MNIPLVWIVLGLLTIGPLGLVAAHTSSPPSWGYAAMGFGGVSETGSGIRIAVIEKDPFPLATSLPYHHAVTWCTDLSGSGGGSCYGTPSTHHSALVAGITHQTAPDAELYLIRLEGTWSGAPSTPTFEKQVERALQLAGAGTNGNPAHVAVVASASQLIHDGVPGFGTATAAATVVNEESNGAVFPLDLTYPRDLVPDRLIAVGVAGNLHAFASAGGIPVSMPKIPGTMGWPGAHPDVIAVAALKGEDTLPGGLDEMWLLSSVGLAPPDPAAPAVGVIEVAAPGVAVSSWIPGGGTQQDDGTSFAAPHVAGLAARFLEAHASNLSNPSWDPRQAFRAALACGSTDIVDPAGYATPLADPAAGYGLPKAPAVLGC